MTLFFLGALFGAALMFAISLVMVGGSASKNGW